MVEFKNKLIFFEFITATNVIIVSFVTVVMVETIQR